LAGAYAAAMPSPTPSWKALQQRLPIAVTEVTIDAEIPAAMFEWSGTFSTSDWDEYLELEAGQQWLGQNEVPVPARWPNLSDPHWDGMSADARTGAFQARPGLRDRLHRPLATRRPAAGVLVRTNQRLPQLPVATRDVAVGTRRSPRVEPR